MLFWAPKMLFPASKPTMSILLSLYTQDGKGWPIRKAQQCPKAATTTFAWILTRNCIITTISATKVRKRLISALNWFADLGQPVQWSNIQNICCATWKCVSTYYTIHYRKRSFNSLPRFSLLGKPNLCTHEMITFRNVSQSSTCQSPQFQKILVFHTCNDNFSHIAPFFSFWRICISAFPIHSFLPKTHPHVYFVHKSFSLWKLTIWYIKCRPFCNKTLFYQFLSRSFLSPKYFFITQNCTKVSLMTYNTVRP